MGKCKNCNHWNRGHSGVYDSDNYGCCNLLTYETIETTNSVVPLCEGCVGVRSRVEDFELVTGITFGCVNWKKK